ncbi:hypothetical protein NP590_15640 [Methylomonas sp. SURF-2]|uniref:Uncharacterized protein n=1 Tax=Methylomonas subterranea TaxID=2952225 RepID=A0ABT1TLC4_9GAMM|nr:hypothetical protein [Methylomonas sp. SURF-2]MCQ8105544.1 hypothetical protein [Methylomonas sp. SURF-2]
MNQVHRNFNRRHLAARELGWSELLVRPLAQANNSANAISLTGMVAVEWTKDSLVGALCNETPDRVADQLILVEAGFGADGHEILGY